MNSSWVPDAYGSPVVGSVAPVGEPNYNQRSPMKTSHDSTGNCSRIASSGRAAGSGRTEVLQSVNSRNLPGPSAVDWLSLLTTFCTRSRSGDMSEGDAT